MAVTHLTAGTALPPAPEPGHYCGFAHTVCTCRPRIFCRDGLIAVPSENGPELMSCPFNNCDNHPERRAS